MDRPRGLHPALAIAVVVALVALLVSILAFNTRAAGGGEEGGDGAPPPAAAEVAVTQSEFAFAPSAISVPEGGIVEITNEGTIAHNFKVREREDEFATPDIQPGDTASLELTGLPAGDYEVYCSIAGHAEAGMTASLTIGGDPTAAATDQPSEGSAELSGLANAEQLRANYDAAVTAFPAETSALGSRLMEPEVQDDGTKLFELTLDEVEWEVAPDQFVEAVGYNGQVPGPWIDVEVGDRITLRVINGLEDEGTTLHPHGVFIHPLEVDGVGRISMDAIMPGETWEATFTAVEPSVGMYHGHDNGLQQVVNGAFGAITVGDMPLPEEADNVVDERVLVLNDAGNVGLTLNGKSFPATEPYSLRQGEQMVLHYYNEGLTAHPMHLHNQPQLVIAKDGYPLASPYLADTVNVAPGERYTVVIFAETPGTWVYHCHILSHVEREDGSVFGMFTALIVEPVEGEDFRDPVRDAVRDGELEDYGPAETASPEPAEIVTTPAGEEAATPPEEEATSPEDEPTTTEEATPTDEATPTEEPTA